jgi:hypothetical protein
MRGPTKSTFTAVCATIALFIVHRLLQQQYYTQCKADLIRVVFYDQSAMCVHISQILQVVEVAYQQVVKQVMSSVLDVLSGGGGGGVGDGGIWT